MFTAYRWRFVSLLALALAASQLAACRKSKPQDKSAQTVAKKSPAEIKQLADAARKSLAGLNEPVDALRARVDELHKEFDPLPPGLVGFGETRAEFYGAAEGIGMMHAKLLWLANRLDAAEKAGDGVALEQVSKDIDATYQDVKSADQMTIALIHKVQPFKTAHEPTVQEVLGKAPKCD